MWYGVDVSVITTEQAAERLGVSVRRVRALIAQGDVLASRVGRDYLVEAESLARLGINRARGRSLSPRMSWVALLSDLGTRDFEWVAGAAGLSRSECARVRVLRERAVEDWSWLARRRATTKRYSVRDGYVDRLLADPRVVRSGLSAIRDYEVDLAVRRGTGEVYVAQDDSDVLATDYLLRAEPAGSLIVHVVDDSLLLGSFRSAPVMTAATVAVDLAESEDVRTRRAAYDLLRRISGG